MNERQQASAARDIRIHDTFTSKRLLRGTIVALAICAALAVTGYFFVDRPVAFWVHDHELSRYKILERITLLPPLAETWAPLVLAIFVIRRAFARVTAFEWAMFAAAVGLIAADEFRESLAIVFGRDWPETWTHNNLSLISNNAYGFHWFQGTSSDNSFPSGHMARTVAVGAVLWIAYRAFAVRALVITCSLLMAISLVGMNYHFVSDVIAGSFVGGIVGTYAAAFCGFMPSSGPFTELKSESR